jgi:hypothetical protein
MRCFSDAPHSSPKGRGHPRNYVTSKYMYFDGRVFEKCSLKGEFFKVLIPSTL